MSVRERRPPPVEPPGTLLRRYGPEHLEAFTDGELARFLPGLPREDAASRWAQVAPVLGWELLYRVEPGLYERLIAGERLHPGILRWLPHTIETAVEVGAGTGRLTVDLAPRCRRLVAIEPAEPMRVRLARRVSSRVRPVAGFFEALPIADRCADLVVACSALTAEPGRGGEAGLAEMQRACAPGGLTVIVWPQDPGWLQDRGFETVTFPGPMAVEFASAEEAVELARIFYPDASRDVARLGDRRVPYEVLGIGAPRTLSWKRAP